MTRFFTAFEWDICFINCEHTDDCWIKCYSVFQYAVENYVPNYKSLQNKPSKATSKTKKKYPHNIRKLFSVKSSLWRKYRLNKNGFNRKAYQSAAGNCKHALYKHSCDIEKNILSGCDLGKFYRFVNSKLSCKSGIAY